MEIVVGILILLFLAVGLYMTNGPWCSSCIFTRLQKKGKRRCIDSIVVQHEGVDVHYEQDWQCPRCGRDYTFVEVQQQV